MGHRGDLTMPIGGARYCILLRDWSRKDEVVLKLKEMDICYDDIEEYSEPGRMLSVTLPSGRDKERIIKRIESFSDVIAPLIPLVTRTGSGGRTKDTRKDEKELIALLIKSEK